MRKATCETKATHFDSETNRPDMESGLRSSKLTVGTCEIGPPCVPTKEADTSETCPDLVEPDLQDRKGSSATLITSADI